MGWMGRSADGLISTLSHHPTIDPAPDTAIGRLVKHLVFVLICVDLCYHIPDMIFAMDAQARGPGC